MKLYLEGGPKDGRIFETDMLGKDIVFLGETLPGTYKYFEMKEPGEFTYQWIPDEVRN